MKTFQYLKQCRITLEKLQKLKQRVDPASGVSIQIRRGPLNAEDPPEWISLETGNNLDPLLNLLIDGQRESLNIWRSLTELDVAHAREELENVTKLSK